MIARAVLVVALGAVLGCAKDLSALSPFPCARDQTCPLGLVCVPGVGCTAARLDGLCSPETDCSLAGGSCLLGICAQPCAPGCPAGRVCARVGGEEACVVDCAGGSACAPGLACKSLWYGDRRGCLPADRTPTACLGTVPEAKPVCGRDSFNVTCANGNTCAENSSCLSSGTSCDCNPGFIAWSCANDQPCSSSNRCSFPNWWCLPEGLSSSCVKNASFTPGRYQCADGREVRATCETSCESVCEDSTRCDPVRQTCGSVTNPKCTFSDTDAGTVITVCVPSSGAVPVGGTCTRDLSTLEANDDCSAGGVCVSLGAPGSLVCRGFCTSNVSCGPGFHCVSMTDAPRVGLCSPDCALFADCGPGATCAPARDFDDFVTARCREISPAALGTPCTLQQDCDALQLCAVQTDGGEGCAALCDPSHPCDGGTCTVIRDSRLPTGSGFCLN